MVAMNEPDVLAPVHAELEEKARAFVREHRLPGAAVGVVGEDRLAWSLGIGFADREAALPQDARALHRIASITKTFTATAILQLRDAGALRLDDPLVAHLREFGQARNPYGPIEDVTIRGLLTHMSGLQGEMPVADPDAWPLLLPDELLAALHRVAVVIPSWTAFKYCNLGFELLAAVVRRATGRTLPEYVAAEILEPLGMISTAHEPGRDLAARCAVGYDARAFDDRPPRARSFLSATMEGDGGLWSSVEDLARWIAAQLAADPRVRERGPGAVLAPATLAEMQRPTYLGDPERDAWRHGQGLGWYATRRPSGVVVTGHSGALNGFTSNISFRVEEKLGAIVLLNGIGGAADLAGDLLEAALVPIRAARAREAAAAPPDPCPPDLARLLGEYRDPEFGEQVRVEWRDGCLWLLEADPDEPDHPLEATDDPLVFTMRVGRPAGERLTFLRGPDDGVDRANMGGYPMVRLVPARAPLPPAADG
jgi:CubicO group peptidase (beta-lactamase class C family)